MASSIEPILAQIPFDDVLRKVGEVSGREGILAYAVGGVVRDAMLGRETTDIDFVCLGPRSGIRLAEAVRRKLGGDVVHVYENFGTAAVRIPLPDSKFLVLEFVGARKESY